MSSQVQVYLFGDQTFDVAPKLRDLLRAGKSPILESFFEKAYYRLRSEIGQLPAREREAYPRFTSLAEIVSWEKTDILQNPALQSALTCVYQLGEFFRQHDGTGRQYPTSTQACISGLCTGALSAAAISCCTSTSELLPLAVETVAVAYRAGLRTLSARDGITASTEPWSLVVSSTCIESILESLKSFSEVNRLPKTSQPYVSAYGLHGQTISGPPAVLKQLQSFHQFGHTRVAHLPIHAPYHAPHLYDEKDIADILRPTTSVIASYAYKSHLPVISSSTGRVNEPGNIRKYFELALRQILMEAFQFQKLCGGISQQFRKFRATSFDVIPVGTTAGAALSSTLQDLGEKSAGRTGEQPANVSELITSGGRPGREKIAIIGMSGRYPSAEDNEEFWSLLFNGLDVHKEAPALHWDVKTHVDPTGTKKNTSATPYGCWLDRPDAFDAQFFNMSPREAPQVDPAQRIALMTAYEAIEQAGIVPDATPSTRKDRVGVFYGVTSNDWMETNSAQNIDTYFIPGGNRAFIPGRINYFFKFSGPSYSVDTACSSSLAAIHVACNSLWNGDIDTAIAGGTNVLTNPDFTAGLDRGHFLSRTGNCKTFDDGADGYCRGEGVGTVILKRLEDAIADKDPIQGLILGAYTNHSAEAESITRPHSGAQKAIFSKVLNEAGIDPYSVSYVEMHGTGTQAGDAGEMTSVLDTFAPSSDKSLRPYRKDGQALYLGSAKSNIGHGEAASGISALAKVLLMMQKSIIPPHCGIKTRINRKFPTDLEARNVRIAMKVTPWEAASGQPRRAFVNNFSAAGGNTALLLEDKPAEIPLEGTDPRTAHLVAVSAKSPISLSRNLASLLEYIEQNAAKVQLGQLSYTTTARRIHHLHRVIVGGSSVSEIAQRLRHAIERGDGATRPKAAPQATFSFTGQGCQHPGMGRKLYDAYALFRSEISRLDKLGRAFGFPEFASYFEDETNSVKTYSPLIVQLATVALQMTLARLWQSWGLVPNSVVGHSLGEYAALNVAGVLTDADTLFIVGRRAQLLEKYCTQDSHTMLVVKSSLSAVETALAGLDFEISCANGPEETVIGGERSHIDFLQRTLKAKGLATILIKVPYAYHTSQVDPILEELEIVAQGVTFAKPKIPVISSLLGETVTEAGTFNPRYLRRHCRESVRFLDAIRSARQTMTIPSRSVFVELGPHPVLTSLVKSILGVEIIALPTLHRKDDTWKVITDTLSQLHCLGKNVDWNEFHRDFKPSHKVLQLPAYNWSLKSYWMQYVNNWSLRKGDAPLVLSAPSRLDSTTVHTVVEDTASKIIVESDIARADLNPLVKGHVVDNIPLCTPSVYADIALTLGKHIIDRYHPDQQDCQLDVADMTIQKALIAQPEGPQPIRTIVEIDWASKKAHCRFATLDNKGEATRVHAKCSIHFTDGSWKKSMQQFAPTARDRMSRLRTGIESGPAQRFNRAMIYKMIKPLAQFHDDYRALDEVVINSDTLEASSCVSFKSVKPDGEYHTHPAYIDGLSQSGGFVMNCKDSTDLEKEVFVNHGWESFQLYQPLDASKTYTTYTQMAENDQRMFTGHLVVFDGNDVVASFKNICLQGVPRRLLKHILSVEAKHKSSSLSAPVARALPAPVAKAKPQTQPQAAAPVPKAIPAPVVKQTVVAVDTTAYKSALAIVSEESGIPEAELGDDAVFADMGVDSLLSLVITSRFREELNIDMALDDLFSTFSTGKALREFFTAGAAAPVSPAPFSSAIVAAPQQPQPTAQPPAASAVDSAVVKTALVIISEESGIPEEELTDDANLTDYGVDSLLSLVITGRFREELDIEVGMDDFFTQFPTVGALKRYFAVPSAAPEVEVVQKIKPVEVATPPIIQRDPIAHCAVVQNLPGFDAALAIIAEESGISMDYLVDDCVFADFGVDSLLSLIITSRFREELGLDVEMDQFFLNFPTVGDLKRMFAPASGFVSTAISEQLDSSSEYGLKDMSSASSATSVSDMVMARKVCVPPATSVLMQGTPANSRVTLFLFPDGAGSATSYSGIHRVAPDVAIIGLNSPFYKTPEDFKCTLDECMDSYLAEIRRRQPHGPYHFGGWSAGGILAYRATQRMMAAGERVEHLVLIDSPVPTGLDKLPQHFYNFCNKHKLFGHGTKAGASAQPPSWLIPHFNATIDLLHEYVAKPLPNSENAPRTSLIWATTSVMDGKDVPKMPPHPDDTEGMKFLTETRTDFSGNGWEKLVLGGGLRVEKAMGQNHFTMMRGKFAPKLATFIREALR